MNQKQHNPSMGVFAATRTLFLTSMGKLIRAVARLRGGSGSALPGLIVERIDPGFMKRTLASLPQGVIVVSGTNGKTTTTKIVVELLRGQGLSVFTNPSGSNFTRGVTSALLAAVSATGRLRADVAVLELDEAHAVHFVRQVAPKHSLLLNVMRDQLDRFGEIDTTAGMLRTIAQQTTDTVILNREDPRVASLRNDLSGQNVVFFGLDDSLVERFPTDDSLRGGAIDRSHHRLPADVILQSMDTESHANSAVFLLDGVPHYAQLQLDGVYNMLNAAAALALCRCLLGARVNEERLMNSLAAVTPAFGRGEKLIVKGQPLELVLVKNPGGFRLGLESFSPDGYATMIAINDNYADGRDMSWLWDVDFDSLSSSGVQSVSGIRATDMALRLHYDNVAVERIEPSLGDALQQFLAQYENQPKRIYCSYTAMLTLRKALGAYTEVETIS